MNVTGEIEVQDDLRHTGGRAIGIKASAKVIAETEVLIIFILARRKKLQGEEIYYNQVEGERRFTTRSCAVLDVHVS